MTDQELKQDIVGQLIKALSTIEGAHKFVSIVGYNNKKQMLEILEGTSVSAIVILFKVGNSNED